MATSRPTPITRQRIIERLGNGAIKSVTNALGQTTLFTSYDANGRPLTIQDPNGVVTTLTYNFRGQVTSRTTLQWVTTYGYDAAGQLIRLTKPDGSYLAFTYDAAHRLTDITDALGAHIHYTLDAASNRTQEQVFDPVEQSDPHAFLQLRSR